MHTKGPWIVESGMVRTESGIPIAHMDRTASNGTTPAERDRNAQLCAASPALLAALESFVDRWSRYPKKPTGDDLRIYLNIARAAIAKATAE